MRINHHQGGATTPQDRQKGGRKMKLKYNEMTYKIVEAPSIFMTRNGLKDITISVSGEWGGYDKHDHNHYRSIAIIATENRNDFIKKYENIPDDILCHAKQI